MYVLVRRDIPAAQQSVQACHAAIEAARKFLAPGDEHPHLVLCGIADGSMLLRERERLDARGVRTACFYEPDIGGELTAIATEPLSGDARRLMRRYKILKEQDLDGLPRSRGPPV